MVAGDAVNTAARVQSAAPPGAVLVDTTTRRLAGLAIEFELHGDVELKGKAEPETCGGPARSSRGIGGAQRATGWRRRSSGEPSSSACSRTRCTRPDQRRPRLVLVSGRPASARRGWGGSWRSTSTGWPRASTGTAAVPTLRRGHGVLGADRDRPRPPRRRRGRRPRPIEDKLATHAGHPLRQRDRPRLRGHPAGARSSACPPTGGGAARAELFAGWRRFFEGLARRQPVLLLVEDLHDADEGLLDFLEHLVDWVRDLPVLVFGVRPPRAGRPAPGPRHRPQPDADDACARWPRPRCATCSRAWSTGCRPRRRRAIEAQAQGIPLFAVETVRSLIDQQVVVRATRATRSPVTSASWPCPRACTRCWRPGSTRWIPSRGRLAAAAAVIAASVHGRDPGRGRGHGRRTWCTPASRSSPGATCSRSAPTCCRRRSGPTASPTACSPRSPTRPCRTATSRTGTSASPTHLAGSARNENDALAEVVARHYLEALEARPNDDDVASLRDAAADWLIRAAERARSTGAPGRRRRGCSPPPPSSPAMPARRGAAVRRPVDAVGPGRPTTDADSQAP